MVAAVHRNTIEAFRCVRDCGAHPTASELRSMSDFARLTSQALLIPLLAAGCGSSTGPGLETQPVALEARRGASLAYDEARKLTVLFGGFGAEEGAAAADRSSTWTYDGNAWRRVATAGPSARHGASMAYDASRQRVVLFGGLSGVFPNERYVADTWEWNGSAWTRITDAGPGLRAHQVMAYDRARNRVVLYGGFDVTTNQELHDIWEWNGTSWTKQSASAAASTITGGIAFDEKAGTLLLLSLDPSSSKIVTDVWNGTALTRSSIAAPPCALMGSPMTGLGAARGGVLWFGACGSTGAQTQLVLSGSSWTTGTGTLPPARSQSPMAYDRDRDRVVVFGGEAVPTGALLGDTWEFDGTTWTRK
jgi:hypothetical protein